MSLVDDALAVLRENDAGRFTKPSQRLYPFQWNWDSAFVAIGLAGVDPERARTEVRSVLEGQWADGMVPHMIFHPQPVDYRPGPELWDSPSCDGAPPLPTSGLIAPPVLATAVRVLHETAPDQAFLAEVVPKLDAWHQWFHRERTHEGSGLMAIFHGWESADNAPRFDRALARIDADDVEPIRRTDTLQVAADERPTELDYRRYLALVHWLRVRGYRPAPVTSSPFAYLDLPLNSILAVAEDDLGDLQAQVGGDPGRARSAAARLRDALATLWDEEAGAFRERDLHAEQATITNTVADLFPLYARVPDEAQARRVVEEHLLSPSRFGPSPEAPWAVTTVARSSPDFAPRNYWRGPIWINVNWFFVRALERYGLLAEATALRESTLALVERSGFTEYYEPTTGEPLGSRVFLLERCSHARSAPPVSYNPEPRYPVVGGDVELGFDPLVAEVASRGAKVVAVDGPPAVAWDELLPSLVAALERRGLSVALVGMRAFYRPWDEIERLTDDPRLAHDPVFARLPAVRLAELLGPLPDPSPAGLTVVAGPGAALVGHDLLWYADVPKGLALARLRDGLVANLGRHLDEAGSERRLLYLDWPILDDHAASIIGRLDRLIDASGVHEPRSLTGDALRASLRSLAGRPFRTRPTFLPGAWGGQWLRRELGIETDAANLAWSYELITPESGILLGDERPVEVGFSLLLAEQGDRVLGASVRERFGRSFPIRFDYLDTLEGGHLSVQCHPRETYAREVFGLDYTQHETYYVMATTLGASVFLGLEDDADLVSFREDAERAARDGVGFEPERYVRRHDAREHQLYLIPAGTVHASGAGNVVLEISATPYLYTLRFYDWLRRDLEGELRPVHVDHAFANIDPGRRGDALAELVPAPRVLREGHGWAELELGRHPDLLFRVNRLELEEAIADETDGRFHVLNLVEGGAVQIETEAGDVQRLSYAETVVIPAAVGRYEVRPLEGTACKLVKAFVA